jgi:prepilin-type N-terminal cleavage/methylation domain-containing protein
MEQRQSGAVLFPKNGRAGQSGFSLIEISLVLVIFGLAMGGIIAAIGPQLELRKYSNTQKQLDEINEAIVAFALVNRRIPCPATLASDGRESFCTAGGGPGLLGCGAEVFLPAATSVGLRKGRCAAAPNAGFVPAVTLGLPGQRADGVVVDAWAAPIRYVVPATVNQGFNNPDTPPVLPDTTCDLGVDTCFPYTQENGIRRAYYTGTVIGSTPPGVPVPAGPPVPVVNTIASDLFICATATGINGTNCNAAAQRANPAFIVYSFGINQPTLGTDEAANANADRVFVSHAKTEPDAPPPNGGFDDLFSWTTFAQLVARLSGAGTP